MGDNTDRKPLFSVTLADCEVQTFRSGGKGGQNQNTRDTGVRIIHTASGARGEARDERSQLQNKKLAFRRMAESVMFRAWVARQSDAYKKIEAAAAAWAQQQVDDMSTIKVEVWEKGRWNATE